MIDCAVIVAVGSPSHQSKLVQDRPRAMLPALGKPLIVRSMEPLYRAGIRRFVLIVGIDEGGAAAYLNRQWLPDVQIEFAIRPPQMTFAQVLSNTAQNLKQPFVLSTYNVFIPVEHVTALLHHADDAPHELVLSGSQETLSADSEQQYAQLVDGRIHDLLRCRRSDTPAGALIASNLAVCGTAFVEYLSSAAKTPQGVYFPEIVRPYLETSGASICLADWVLSVQSDADLLLLNKKLLAEGSDAHILCEVPHSVRIISPVRIDPGVSIGQHAVIGPNAYLERNASVGTGAQIRNAVVIERASVTAGTVLENTILSRKGPVVG